LIKANQAIINRVPQQGPAAPADSPQRLVAHAGGITLARPSA
jgi:hypothetical protein